MSIRPDRPEDLSAKIVAALDRLARARRLQQQATATRHRLTPLQVELLGALADGQPPRPLVTLLAAEVGVAQPTATASLRTLERKGLVERYADPTDARRTPYRLTTAGRRLTEDLAAGLTEANTDLVAAIGSLPADRQASVFESLLSVIAELVDAGAISVARTCLTCTYHEQVRGVHRCSLLGIDLPPAELRVNCPEHQPA